MEIYAETGWGGAEETGVGYSDESTSLKVYFGEIAVDNRRLSRAEEASLSQRIQQGDRQARDGLVRANLPFVITVAKRYQRRGLGLADLICAGNVGLITAAERFDGARGHKFISYAVWWIRQAIIQAIGEQSTMVRLPFNKRLLIKDISETARRLGHGAASEPTLEDVAQAMGVAVEDVADTLQAVRVPQSLDQGFAAEDERRLHDVIADERQEAPDVELMRSLSRTQVHQLLANLSRREADILRLYLGIDDHTHTLQEIGAILNLTRERVRQIKKQAVEKLRHPRQRQLLRGLVEDN